MRAAKTVFIVGAGASAEVDLPFGKGFLAELSRKLNYQIRNGVLVSGSGDEDVFDAIQEHAHGRDDINSYLAAARRIREGIAFSKSIDTFMDAHRNDLKIQLLGKLAIAKTILEKEHNSYLNIPERSREFKESAKVNESWYAELAKGLNDGIGHDRIDHIFEKVSFIVFNYDRCVEHYLEQSVRKHYGLPDSEVYSVLKSLSIMHPYGTIANLPWQDSQGLPFGFPGNRPNLLKMARQIKTFTERVENADELLALKNEIAEAEVLVFLGFSYHDLNLEILDPGRECAARHVFGTAFGISDHNVEEIKDQLRPIIRRSLTESRVRGASEIVSERLHIRNDLTCVGLLQEYSRTLFFFGDRSRS